MFFVPFLFSQGGERKKDDENWTVLKKRDAHDCACKMCDFFAVASVRYKKKYNVHF